ncbi:MAG: polysaccharide ABC transporter ATP-binding protein [Bacteroidales bacterium]|nr:polysaccharide ABC transporter ATP-binding protein [Bacteroidales bacterium]
MPISIKIENLSKQYRLGVIGTGTLSHDLKRWWTTSIRGKEDPYLKIGETNDRTTKGSSDYIWALKDINLEIAQGDVVGIIGKNGAGKSTLLKILSRVTKPTTGSIQYNGRIASLLEVGTGFHPEMTGRENIYMNGAIMGMTRHEISSKLDEIIAFAGVERYIDTPVKRYSSGMTVRLGFSIAAHLEPDILVVDEVLAVGDAEFQKKAIGKMQDVSKGGGRTVLFVSHNMAAVSSLCRNSILLENGLLKDFGNTKNIIRQYSCQAKKNSRYSKNPVKNYIINLVKATLVVNNENNQINLIIKAEIISKIKKMISFDIRLSDAIGTPVAFGSLGVFADENKLVIGEGGNSIKIQVHLPQLANGLYSINIDLTDPFKEYYDRIENCFTFEYFDAFRGKSRSFPQEWNYGFVELNLTKI